MNEQKQFRILVVDDAFSMRRALRGLLEDLDYVVEEAMNGEHALARLRQRNIDLVVTDLQMPKMDGITLVREVRADDALKYLPVIMLTGNGRSYKEEALAAGVNVYISKSEEDKYDQLVVRAIKELLSHPAP